MIQTWFEQAGRAADEAPFATYVFLGKEGVTIEVSDGDAASSARLTWAQLALANYNMLTTEIHQLNRAVRRLREAEAGAPAQPLN